MYLKSEELCRAIREERDVAGDVALLEPQLKGHYRKRRKTMLENPAYSEFAHDSLLYAWDALYDVSTSVKKYWDTVYPLFKIPEGKYGALLRFVNMREKFLGIPHKDSIRILRTIGWTPADIMAAYLWNRCGTSTLTLSPDVVADAVREDMDTALRLMDKEGYSLFSSGYSIYMNFEWLDFMYFFFEYQDRTFLMKQHKSKRLCKYCQEVLKKLEAGPANTKEISKETGQPECTELSDFSVFEGIVLKQRHLMASAAGQRLRKGNDNNGYYVLSYHVTDEVHGYGAALRFDAFTKAPEYAKEERPAWGVYFYRFHYLMLFDHVPESWRVSPAELPEDFVKKVYRAFSMLAGEALVKYPEKT